MGNRSLAPLLARYRERKELLPLLKEIQETHGCIPREFIPEIASSLDLSIGEVYGVRTFYSFLSQEPRGRNVIRACKSVPCWLKNRDGIIATLEKKLGIKPGQRTPDGRFSLELVNCIGYCDHDPAMMINDITYGDLTPEKISEVLDGYD